MINFRVVIGSAFLFVGAPAAILAGYVPPGSPHLNMMFGFFCFAAMGGYLLSAFSLAELARHWPVYAAYVALWFGLTFFAWWVAQ